MKFNKERFLKTEFGAEMVNCARCWDKALEEVKKHGIGTEERRREQKAAEWMQAQWEVYQLAVKQFYGIEYHFTRTTEYFGIVTDDESDWLLRVERESWYEARFIVPGTDGDAENGPCEPQGWEDYIKAHSEDEAMELANEKAKKEWQEPNFYEPDVPGPSDKEMGAACPVCVWVRKASDEEYAAWKKEMETECELPWE